LVVEEIKRVKFDKCGEGDHRGRKGRRRKWCPFKARQRMRKGRIQAVKTESFLQTK
jgi:hypothetical protein